MAELNIAPINKGDGSELSFEVSITLTEISNSAWYYIPAGINRITVTVVPSGGAECVVQTTTDSIEDIEAGNETAVNWDLGIVSTTNSDVTVGRVNAIRCSQTEAGSVKFTVNC